MNNRTGIREYWSGLDVRRRRVSLPNRLLVPNCLGYHAIHFERRESRSSNGTDAYRPAAAPAKVKTPGISTRIEERNFFSALWISGCLTTSLSKRTRNARQRQILQRGFTPCHDGRDMINVESGFLANLRKTAIFAPVLRPLNHLPPQRERNVHALRRGERSPALSADAKATGPQPVQPSPRLLAVLPRSMILRDLVCRAEPEDGAPRPAAGETLPNRRAFRFQVESPAAYLIANDYAKSELAAISTSAFSQA
jgi:hypothetical protein